VSFFGNYSHHQSILVTIAASIAQTDNSPSWALAIGQTP
jgi:hypothetical protein